MEVKIITDVNTKSNICKVVLNDLHEWFGIEESKKQYIEMVKKYVFFAMYENETPVAFYSIKEENINTLEMVVLGVLKKYQHQGIGTKLQKSVEEYAKKNGYINIIVLTLASKHKDVAYAATRKFYYKQGFEDIYQSDKIWDEFNPCQIMLKRL
ncbi:MAG: GNAT family N-acetyltransferase [Firmicutes bacterium]|nr:GNAT family N-acetyltransferase [Bacillota bacterium]